MLQPFWDCSLSVKHGENHLGNCDISDNTIYPLNLLHWNIWEEQQLLFLRMIRSFTLKDIFQLEHAKVQAHIYSF